MTDEEAFLKLILADPDNDSPRLVYADWLDDDYANFIRVQLAIASLPGVVEGDFDPDVVTTGGLIAAERALFQGDYVNWWKLVPWVPKDWTLTNHAHQIAFRVGPAGERQSADFWVYPRRGFAEVIECSYAQFLEYGDAIVATTPLREAHLFDHSSWDFAELTARFKTVKFVAAGPAYRQPAITPQGRSIEDTLQALPPINLPDHYEYIAALPHLSQAARDGFVLAPPDYAPFMPDGAERAVASFTIGRREFYLNSPANMAREIERMRAVAVRTLLRDLDDGFVRLHGQGPNPADFRVNVVEVPDRGFIRQGTHRDVARQVVIVTLAADYWYTHRSIQQRGPSVRVNVPRDPARDPTVQR